MAEKEWRASPLWVWRQLRKGPPDGMLPKDHRRIVFRMWRGRVHPAWAKSTLEFFIGHAVRWLWMVPGTFLGLIALYGSATDNPNLEIAPSIIWGAISIGFLIAALAEFHRVRRERDELAADPQIALNEHLSEGHKLRDRMQNRDAPKVRNAIVKLLNWNFQAEATVRSRAPAYYGRWRSDVQKYEENEALERFVAGLDCLEEICRAVGLRPS